MPTPAARSVLRIVLFISTTKFPQGVPDKKPLFPVPCSLFPVPCSLFPVPCSLFPVPCSLFPVPCSLPLTSLRPLASSVLPPAPLLPAHSWWEQIHRSAATSQSVCCRRPSEAGFAPPAPPAIPAAR